MITAWLNDNLQALQLKETLVAAGFAAKEISITSPVFLGLTQRDSGRSLTRTKEEHRPGVLYCLNVQTQTGLDQDLAEAVFRDCGVPIQTPEIRSFKGGMTVPSPKKPAKDRTIIS
jgi:hypothetical protein